VGGEQLSHSHRIRVSSRKALLRRDLTLKPGHRGFFEESKEKDWEKLGIREGARRGRKGTPEKRATQELEEKS